MNLFRSVIFVFIAISGNLYSQTYFPNKLNGKFGYIDTLNNWVIKPEFDRAGPFSMGKAIAQKSDSLFLIINKDRIVYLPDLKNYHTLDSLHMAVQDITGKWAIADVFFRPLTGFVFTRIINMDSFFVVWQNRNMGLLDKDFRQVFECTYISIERFRNGHFKVRSMNSQSIYSYDNKLNLLLSEANLNFSQEHPGVYTSINQKKKSLMIFNRDGDSIYSCSKCSLLKSFDSLIFVKEIGKVSMLNVNNGGKLGEFEEDIPIVNSPVAPFFLYLPTVKKLFLPGSCFPLFTSNDKFDTLQHANRDFIFVKRNNKWGVLNFKKEIVVPFDYNFMNLLENNMLIAQAESHTDLYYLTLGKKVLSAGPGTTISVDETSVLLFKNNGRSVLYEINDSKDLVDSAAFKNLEMIRAGKRTFIPNSLVSAGINTNLNLINNRWFIRRSLYGLAGLNGDTLLKARYDGVSSINDSLDIVWLRCVKVNIRFVNQGGLCSVKENYGIINNRTGKYVLNPVFFYIDIDQYRDTSFRVARVLLRTGNFALMDKKTFRLVEGSECTYIAGSEGAYMRLFYKAKFYSRNLSVEINGTIPQYLSSSTEFWHFGDIDESRRWLKSVFVVSGRVNVSDKNGKLFWDEALGSRLSFVDKGLYGNFISVSHDNKYGVISAGRNVIVPNDYSSIKRLASDDRYFLLKSLNPKFGYLDRNGYELTEAIFTEARNFRDDYTWCSIDDSMMLINRNGNLTPGGIRKVRVGEVNEGYTSIRTSKGWKIMDVEGNIQDHEVYKKIKPFVNGVAAVMQSKGWGLIDENGGWILKPGLDNYEAENENTVVFSDNNHYIFYSRDGNVLNKIKKRGDMYAEGKHYFIVENAGLRKIYREDGSEFRKKRFKNDVRCIRDTVLSVGKFGIVLFGPEGKRLERLKHNGGVKSFDKHIMKMDKDKPANLTFTLKVTQAQHYLYKDVFEGLSEQITLTKPIVSNRVILLNLGMNDCIKYNAFVYFYKAGDTKYYMLSDSLGNLLINQEFSDIRYAGYGLFKATFFNENGEQVVGLLNNYGLWVVEPKFRDIKPFVSGIATYTKQSDFWIADSNGHLISDEVMVDYSLHEGYYCLMSETKIAWWHPDKGWISAFSR